MTCRVNNGRVIADLVIDWMPLDVIPLMRTKLHVDVDGATRTRLYARSVQAIDAARQDRAAYLASVDQNGMGGCDG